VQSVHCETDRIDLREHCIDLGKQHVITKDTVQINVDAVLYYQIADPVLAVYSIANLPDALTLLTQTTLRNIIAQITLDETFSSRDLINQRLRDKTSRDAERWGVSITRVEIMNIFAPEDIRDAMEKQIKEERERRSSVLRADGEREAAIVSSKGNAAKVPPLLRDVVHCLMLSSI
jgi:regulator of protease activity HflC (stomatin/prohibitin superfamily)